jgi:outer membrane protein OmpA-like peptidoglycan-associated protein
MGEKRAVPNRQAETRPPKQPSHPSISPTSTQIGVLRLQTAIGNQATQRLLSGRRFDSPDVPKRIVQRFEGPEHAEIGDATGQTIDLGNDVVLTWGQVVAIAGDEVGSVEELRELVKTDTGKARLRVMLETAGVPGDAVKTLPAPTDAQRTEQTGQFLRLLLDNKTHFTSGDEAINAWRSHHVKAVDMALKAGLFNNRSDRSHLQEAYLTEAFGQHFLTDMFSGGHVRTPRNEITDWYVGTFAPKFIDNFINNLRERLVNGIYAQIAPQSWRARNFPDRARARIRAGLNERLNAGIAQLGGRQELVTYFGKAVAGIISGVIHDTEGARGVMVSSAAHPEPWKAMGDSKLNEGDSTNKEQAQAAVQAALDDVNRAYLIGQTEGSFRLAAPVPDELPSIIYFKFNSDSLIGSAQTELEKAAAFLAYNQDTHLDLIGHTDPIGSDAFNMALGQRRADSVEQFIKQHNIPDAQVEATSNGESTLATTNARNYALNRRVQLIWTNRPLPPGSTNDGDQIAFERASQAVLEQIGPPFANVENLLPAAVPDENEALPDWRWESLSAEFRDQFNEWVKNRFGKDLQDKLLDSDDLRPQQIEGFDVNPRTLVEAMLTEMSANPHAFVDSLLQGPTAGGSP